MEAGRITALILKHIRQEISEGEQAELNAWLEESPYNRERFVDMIREENLVETMSILEEAENMKPEMYSQMTWHEGRPKPAKRFVLQGKAWWRTAAAAAVLIGLLITGIVLWQNRQGPSSEIKPSLAVRDLPPGDNRATLTLDDGKVIPLDSAGNGVIALQGGRKVVKTADGRLEYQKGVAGQPVGFNTVMAPRGGQHQVTLPDGTKVWLNAQSSIRFPTAFIGSSREVTMTGEVFFEVAKDKTKPFRVSTGGVTVVALGTEFDVMAYPDEQDLRATLQEGSIKVTQGTQNKTLVPGQQALVTGNITLRKVDVEEVTAWKNGLFEFNGADIETVMRAIGRWYDVEIHYEAGKDQHTFTGQVSRTSTAGEALKILATSGYHFKIEGKVITVLP